MKTRVLVVAAAMFFLSACGAFYGNEKQYDEGDWYLLASSAEVARIKEDKLALEKLKAAPVQTDKNSDVPQGYKGIVANLSNYARYNFKIAGRETKSYLLGPGERAIDYLIPGNYICIVYYGGYQVGFWRFKVGPQLNVFMNEKYHWYVYTDR